MQRPGLPPPGVAFARHRRVPVRDNSVMTRHMDDGIASVLAAIGKPTRLVLLRLLAEQECGAGECAQHTGLTPSGVRQHLNTLASAGLVQTRRCDGTQFYRLVDAERVRSLLDAADRLAQQSLSDR
jgi:DNA-binding transcriptional ArsR family regulator